MQSWRALLINIAACGDEDFASSRTATMLIAAMDPVRRVSKCLKIGPHFTHPEMLRAVVLLLIPGLYPILRT